jgi:hypothetical protein
MATDKRERALSVDLAYLKEVLSKRRSFDMAPTNARLLSY